MRRPAVGSRKLLKKKGKDLLEATKSKPRAKLTR